MFVLSFPGIISCILIYPTDHYLLIPGTMAMIAVAMLINDDCNFNSTSTLNAFVALGVLLAVPVMSDIQKSSNDNKNTINQLISMGMDEPVNILAAEGVYSHFLGTNYNSVIAYEKNSDFEAYMKKNNISLVILSNALEEHPRFVNDPAWHDFINNCENSDFSVLAVSNSANRIFISKSIKPK